MKISELIYENECKANKTYETAEIENIATKKEDIDENSLFILHKSINFDINKIINYIINKKPKAIVCDNDTEIESESILILKTDNTRKLLPKILVRFYQIDLNSMKFIGITGTAGKTTTATMIYHILANSGVKTAFMGTGKIIIDGEKINSDSYSMTTPDPIYLYSILRKIQDSKCEAVIMEISSHALHFEKVLPIVFDISVFTNLSPEHMDFHIDMEDYYNTKLKLFSQSKTGIFNMDDIYSAKAYSETKCKRKSIGILHSADSVATDICMNGFSGSEYIFVESKRLFKIKLQLGGAFNIYNSMLAIKTALEFGISPCDVKKAISTLETIDGRMETVHTNPTIIIDYAHTIDEMESALKFIKSNKKSEQKLITVFGCGGERDKSKRPEMAKIAEANSDFVIVTLDNSRNESEAEIIKDILSGFKNKYKRKVIKSRKSAIEHAVSKADTDDIIALIGKGHEKYNIDKTGCHSFDERAIISNIFSGEEIKV